MKNMNETDLDVIEGGVIPWIITVTAGALIVSIVNGWSDFKAGYVEGYTHQAGQPPL